MLGGQLRIQATFPVRPTITILDKGKKVVVDVPGAEVGALKPLPIIGGNVTAARSGQFQPDTARVVLEFREPSGLALLGDGQAATELVFNPSAVTAAPVAAVPVAPRKSSPVLAARRGGVDTRKAIIIPTTVSGITLRKISDSKVQIVVKAGRAPQVRTALAKGQLTLDLFNATLGATATANLTGLQHPLLRAVRLIAQSSSATRLALDLTRVVTYSVKPGVDGSSLVIDLNLPRNAGGKLEGKLIVVDAGHGGHDGGARGVNGAHEKDVNLGIAMNLAEYLRDAGANVIITRGNDAFIDLGERSAIANRAGADFFISCHSDSTGGRSSGVNGSTVYFHLDSQSCRALAQCIADRLGDMGGIRCNGPRSDGKIYTNGFSVLRRSQMVSVLVECGFMTNPGDANRLVSGEYQQKTARAIADGLRDYIEGNPYFDTRNINPQPEILPLPALPPGGEEEIPPIPDPTSDPNPLPMPPAVNP